MGLKFFHFFWYQNHKESFWTFFNHSFVMEINEEADYVLYYHTPVVLEESNGKPIRTWCFVPIHAF